MNKDQIKQVHAIYSGAVQGVGFRFTAESLSRSYGIKGWVRNTLDGSVELVAQGKSQNVDLFIQALKNEFRIRNVQLNDEPIQPITGFDIRF